MVESNQGKITVVSAVIAACTLTGKPKGTDSVKTVNNIQLLFITDDDKVINVAELADHSTMQSYRVAVMMGMDELVSVEKIPLINNNIIEDSDFNTLKYIEGINSYTEKCGDKELCYMTFDTINDTVVGVDGVESIKYYVLHTQDVPQNGNFMREEGPGDVTDEDVVKEVSDNLLAVIKDAVFWSAQGDKSYRSAQEDKS